MSKKKQSVWPLAELFLPWVVLFFLAFYTVGYFMYLPYAGFHFGANVVSRVYSHPSSLQPGDTLLRIGEVTADSIDRDLSKGYFENLKAGQTVEIAVSRQGSQIVFPYTLPGISAEEVFGRLSSQWFIPYIFWLAGTAALLFLRPRSLTRLLLALFCYLTAAWLAPSNLSDKHFWNAALALRSAVWLSLPVYLHLHWLFPTPLRRLPVGIWGALYAVCVALAVFSWLQWVPQNTYFIGVLLMLAGSLALLVLHLIVQPAERRALAGLAVALGLALLPAIGVGILGVLKIASPFDGIVILSLAALPGFYFFTLFRRQFSPDQARRADRLVHYYVWVILGGLLFCGIFGWFAQFTQVYQLAYSLDAFAFIFLIVIAFINFVPFLVLPALANESITLAVGGTRLSFSANRAAAGIFFLLLDALAVVVVVITIRWLNVPGADGMSLIVAALVPGTAALLGFRPFRRFFEHTVLGMPLSPERLTRVYAGRIITSLELDALRSLLLEEVMPSLLVREFAQFELRGSTLELAFSLRVETAGQLAPDRAGLERAVGQPAGQAVLAGLPAWVRLVLPLRAAGETRGYWLLGRRDPDDRYSEEDIATLQTLADQTALALINISQAEALRALHFADIERHEAERLQMAAELHDDVLNQLAVLNLTLQDVAPAAQQAYDRAVFHIRQIINGLRPPMLQYGLFAALETLTDELNDLLAAQVGPRIVLEIPSSTARYEERVELALFRIVQQACGNAVQHAQSKTIRISGSLLEGQAGLIVSDDGRGMPAGSRIDLPALLQEKHFGLAGMFERAALIGARLEIVSQPGQGCRVDLRWQKK